MIILIILKIELKQLHQTYCFLIFIQVSAVQQRIQLTTVEPWIVNVAPYFEMKSATRARSW